MGSTNVLLAAVIVGVVGAATMMSEEVPKEDSYHILECPGEGPLSYWFLHGKGQGWTPETDTEELTVFLNGSIAFKSIKVKHAGSHLCIRQVNNEFVAYPVNLKVRPRPSQNLWADVYQYQFITGLLAAIVCLALFGFSCLVYHKRWRPEDKTATTPIVEAAYDNPALAEEEGGSTKM